MKGAGRAVGVDLQVGDPPLGEIESVVADDLPRQAQLEAKIETRDDRTDLLADALEQLRREGHPTQPHALGRRQGQRRVEQIEETRLQVEALPLPAQPQGLDPSSPSRSRQDHVIDVVEEDLGPEVAPSFFHADRGLAPGDQSRGEPTREPLPLGQPGVGIAQKGRPLAQLVAQVHGDRPRTVRHERGGHHPLETPTQEQRPDQEGGGEEHPWQTAHAVPEERARGGLAQRTPER